MREGVPRITHERRMSREEIAKRFQEVLRIQSRAICESLGAVRNMKGSVPIVGDACQINPDAFIRSKAGGPYEKEKTEGSVLWDAAKLYERYLQMQETGILDTSGQLDEHMARHRGVPDELIEQYAAWNQANPTPKPKEQKEGGVTESVSEEVLYQYVHAKHEQQKKCFGAVVNKFLVGETQDAGSHAELAVLVMLQKALGDAYVVVRTSPHDDVFNGLDTVVLERATGNVICTFDELHDDLHGAAHSRDRYADKWKRNTGRIRRGEGFSLKYGLRYENSEQGNALVRTNVDEVPAFPVRLRSDDLAALIESGDVFGEGFTSRECDVLRSMLTEAREQAEQVAQELPNNPQATMRIEHITTLINSIESNAV